MTQYFRRPAGTASGPAASPLALTAFAVLALTCLAPASAALAAPPAPAVRPVPLTVRAAPLPGYAVPVPVRYVLPGYDGPEDDELAGSVAGAGREHPGRPAAEPANPETVLASRPLLPVRPRPAERVAPAQAEPSRPPGPQAQAMGGGPGGRAADLAAHILPLGTGFALMGLGLGYMGVRLRQL
ncbi:hypothetical protein ACIBEA_27765 [Streptomyces sp. NPDC051555]|uniref:hypothetical protein n=1 Tax=Streptomyces sp. NPDC051555 TaxID=3365657 RepID=UPI0037B72072